MKLDDVLDMGAVRQLEKFQFQLGGGWPAVFANMFVGGLRWLAIGFLLGLGFSIGLGIVVN